MLVVGATYPARNGGAAPGASRDLSFLVPGIGAQGGDLDATLAAGLDAQGAGLLINSSRSIIYAGGGASAAIRAAAVRTACRDQPGAREMLATAPRAKTRS